MVISVKLEHDNIDNFFRNMKRCSRCILPETFPGIKFDRNGVCNYCSNYRPLNVPGMKELLKVLSYYKDRGAEYDCMVPVSGGRDSSFVLNQVAKKCNLKILAISIDTGERTYEATRNLERMIEILKTDYVELKDETRIEKSKMNLKRNFKAWLKHPSINLIIPILNLPTKMINVTLYSYAKKNDIPLIIGGLVAGNASFEQEHFKTGYFNIFPNDDGNYSNYDKARLATRYGYEYLQNPNYLNLSGLIEGTSAFTAYFFDGLFRPNGVKLLGFYDYVYWNEHEIISNISSELDWRGASDTTTTWRIDDKSSSLSNYIYLRLVGFTEHDEMYSKMILENQISREEGLRRCISDQKPRIFSLRRILEELDVTKDELDYAIDTYRFELLNKILH